MPSSDGCDNFVEIGLPNQWWWLLATFCNEAVDGGLEIDDGVEHAIFESALLSGGKTTQKKTKEMPPSARTQDMQSTLPANRTGSANGDADDRGQRPSVIARA
jgi:hypothetical protein